MFKINYCYYPYTKVSKSLSFENNAIIIFNSTGMLNITKLEYYYNNQDSNQYNFSSLNQIHISMSFDKKYTDLALVTIASVLNTSNSNTYIHFHILGLDFGFEEIKKIIDLRRINNKIDFIFI